jgi:hypothetical protein
MPSKAKISNPKASRQSGAATPSGEPSGEIVLYTAPDGTTSLDVKLERETVWLSQVQMGELFAKDRRTISEHIGNVFKEKELSKKRTIRKFRIVQKEGDRPVVRAVDFYNLDVIISVGAALGAVMQTFGGRDLSEPGGEGRAPG